MNHEFRMYVGPMFGGKTTRMLSQVERYSYMGEDTIVFKPTIDARYDNASIVTHTGVTHPAILVNEGIELERIINKVQGPNPSIIAVDEAFMISGCGHVLVNLFKRGHTILISSLQLSSDGSAYKEVQNMFPYATHIEVCPAIDQFSKQNAYYTEKYGGRSDHKIEVGGAEMYRPRDWTGFFANG